MNTSKHNTQDKEKNIYSLYVQNGIERLNPENIPENKYLTAFFACIV